tara:strand:- start:378 stop:602 length:225 start_codon:yes stop_codon:yes gene_type:complete
MTEKKKKTTRRRTDNGQFVDVGKYRALVNLSYKEHEFEKDKNFDPPDSKMNIKGLLKEGLIEEVDENGDIDGEN